MRVFGKALWYLVRLPFRLYFFHQIFRIIKTKGAKSIPVWMREEGESMLKEEWILENDTFNLSK